MKKGTTCVVVDDSKRKAVVAIRRPGLRRQGPVPACHEAGVSGDDLYRQITAYEVSCQEIAPALAPRRPGRAHLFRMPRARSTPRDFSGATRGSRP